MMILKWTLKIAEGVNWTHVAENRLSGRLLLKMCILTVIQLLFY